MSGMQPIPTCGTCGKRDAVSGSYPNLGHRPGSRCCLWTCGRCRRTWWDEGADCGPCRDACSCSDSARFAGTASG